MHIAYDNLCTQLEGDQDAMANALREANQRMAGGLVWSGPSGSAPSTFTQQLAQKHGDLSGKVSSTVGEVQQALNSTPQSCSEPQCQPPGRCWRLPFGPRGRMQ
jgi:hypothetical protein